MKPRLVKCLIFSGLKMLQMWKINPFFRFFGDSCTSFKEVTDK